MLPLISSPSSATSERLQGHLEHANVLIHHECLSALLVLLGLDTSWNKEENQVFSICASAFFDEYSDMKNRTHLTGIFGRRVPMTCNEISKSSSLAVHLQNYLAGFQGVELMGYHQFEDPSGGKMDIMLASAPANAELFMP
jgi:hypothetical protein